MCYRYDWCDHAISRQGLYCLMPQKTVHLVMLLLWFQIQLYRTVLSIFLLKETSPLRSYVGEKALHQFWWRIQHLVHPDTLPTMHMLGCWTSEIVQKIEVFAFLSCFILLSSSMPFSIAIPIISSHHPTWKPCHFLAPRSHTPLFIRKKSGDFCALRFLGYMHYLWLHNNYYYFSVTSNFLVNSNSLPPPIFVWPQFQCVLCQLLSMCLA